MTSNVAYIGLGSNLETPLEQLRKAIASLSSLPESRLLGLSRFYRSRAVGPADQPDYVNAVARLETSLSPTALLDHLQHIENQQGRVRHIRWGARTLDLDILLFGDCTLATPRLTLPHPEVANRDFVLQPLLDLAPDLSLPDGRRISELRRQCPDNHLIPLEDA